MNYYHPVTFDEVAVTGRDGRGRLVERRTKIRPVTMVNGDSLTVTYTFTFGDDPQPFEWLLRSQRYHYSR